MKILTRTILASLLALCSLPPALRAQNPTPSDPFVKGAPAADNNSPWKNCLVIFEAYALDKNEAQSVLDAERGSVARYRLVMELTKANKARLATLTALTSKSGQRAVTEANDEIRYATEFTTPATKNSSATPADWEWRNVGDTLEVDINVGPDGRTCELNLVPVRATFLGFRDVSGTTSDALIPQPLFNAQRITTSIELRGNEAAYLGTMTPPAAQGIANGETPSEVWLTFLHVLLPGPTTGESKLAAKSEFLGCVNLEYSCYSLDRKAAREILVGATTLTAPWEKMQALRGAGKARLEHVMTLKTKSGQRAVVTEAQEIRYPTQYVSESRKASTVTMQNSVKNQPNTKTDVSERIREDATTTRTDTTTDGRPGYARDFETRNAGVTVEAEPVSSPDGIVDLSQSIQSVAYRGDLQATGATARFPASPLFESRKITNSQTLLVGRNILVGTLNPPGADGVNERADTCRTWLLFVRANNEQ